MNWQQFKKSVGMYVQIEPPACHLDGSSHILPDLHEDWIIESFENDDVICLVNQLSNQKIKLGKDHIYDFRSNPNHLDTGHKHGFLILKVQIYCQDDKLWLRPNSRPGERVTPTSLAHHQLQWTPFTEVIAASALPPTATSAKIQYRLWSERPNIPLIVRFSLSNDGAGTQELSGPSGVATQLVTEDQKFYISLSHPEAKCELTILGYQFER